MPPRVDLFVVDGENDFCVSGKEPDSFPWAAGGKRRGSLYVENADVEAQNVALFINECVKLLTYLHITLDKHHKNDCSHNTSYKMQDGSTPPPFTVAFHKDFEAQTILPRFPFGVWQGKNVPSLTWALNYTELLEKHGRSPLTLWPEHCLIETWGANIYWPLQQAYDHWCDVTGRWIDPITKGQYPFTEHYSALVADVPDTTRYETQFNTAIVEDVAEADIVIWTGWAGSHCLRWTALDAINHFVTEEKKTGINPFLKKCIFASDACASVPNPPGPGAPDFVQWRLDFLAEVERRGGKVMTLNQIANYLKKVA